MNVVVLRYRGGNIQSVLFALQRIGVTPTLSSDPEIISKADRVMLPGVGEASGTMKELKASGLDTIIPKLKQPFLGICLGLQLMCKHSEEGDVDCLNIFNLNVKKFVPGNTHLKVPHVGWDSINNLKGPLFKGISEDSFVYYVHSFYAEVGQNTCAKTDYINPFSAALTRDNFHAVQFHPEKSGTVGELILKNFIEL
ncbi:MAG TPA: imidazole glycerol phosphate synthase subunit HisH [Bacteroidia bacterium]|jgi:glutamine amidotransferase|nr:imidazole glycerol phosphate synthase subunit HisH [Bacteroidia bacterium]